MPKPLTRYDMLKESVALKEELRGITKEYGDVSASWLFEHSPRALELSREIALLTGWLGEGETLRLDSELELLGPGR